MALFMASSTPAEPTTPPSVESKPGVALSAGVSALSSQPAPNQVGSSRPAPETPGSNFRKRRRDVHRSSITGMSNTPASLGPAAAGGGGVTINTQGPSVPHSTVRQLAVGGAQPHSGPTPSLRSEQPPQLGPPSDLKKANSVVTMPRTSAPPPSRDEFGYPPSEMPHHHHQHSSSSSAHDYQQQYYRQNQAQVAGLAVGNIRPDEEDERRKKKKKEKRYKKEFGGSGSSSSLRD